MEGGETADTDYVMIERPQMLHLIDETLTLTNELGHYLKDVWNLNNQGLAYNYLGVFGSQSTGKSTLLNLLFKTQFDTMSETRRQQTTKGLWLSLADVPNTLVMDVEGTDGRERGENQDMERKSALFSLAVAQVLIINMFEQDVGRYNGANYGLLKTVFDVNLQLFQSKNSPRTLLLFVIRDHTSTPLSNLADTLKDDLRRMWSELTKPKGFESSTIEDFFDFKFVALAHKIFQFEKFVSEVAEFRQWFVDPEHEDYVFKPEYHKKIPIDGLPRFVEDIWEQIITNKDLDLPTQRQLLAQYRCDEIAKVAYDNMSGSIKSLSAKINSGEIIEDLGSKMTEMKNQIQVEYRNQASRYEQTVFEKVEKELIEKSNSALFLLYTEQLQNLMKKCTQLFVETFENELKAKTPFSKSMKKAENETLSLFNRICSEMTIPSTNWDFTPRFLELKEFIQTTSQNRKSVEIEKETQKISKSLRTALGEEISICVENPKENMWKSIEKAIIESVSELNIRLQNFDEDFNCTTHEKEAEISKIKSELYTHLYETLLAETTDTSIQSKLKKRFERHFKFDEGNRPRVWSKEDDVNRVFDEAKINAGLVLNLFCKVDPTIDLSILSIDLKDVPPLIPEKRKAQIWERFELESNMMYQETQRSLTQSITSIPPYFYVLLLVLGWNELWTVLTNPLYLFTFLIGIGFIYIIYTLNLQGPVIQISKNVASQALNMAKTKIDQKSESSRESSSSSRNQKLKTL